MRPTEANVVSEQASTSDDGGGEEDELDDKMRRCPHLFMAQPRPSRMFGYKWAEGYVSPFVASDDFTVARLLAKVRPSASDVVYDLGCGQGQFLIEAARVYGCRGLGVDLDKELLKQARAAAAAAGVSERVEFRAVDLHELPLEDATVVVVFLLPAALSSIAASLEAHLRARPGAVVASVMWDIPELSRAKLELVRIPAEAAEHSKPFFLYGLEQRFRPRDSVSLD